MCVCISMHLILYKDRKAKKKRRLMISFDNEQVEERTRELIVYAVHLYFCFYGCNRTGMLIALYSSNLLF